MYPRILKAKKINGFSKEAAYKLAKQCGLEIDKFEFYQAMKNLSSIKHIKNEAGVIFFISDYAVVKMPLNNGSAWTFAPVSRLNRSYSSIVKYNIL